MSAKFMSISVVGATDVQRQLQALATMIPQRVADALHDEAELTMTEAKDLTPVVTGALRASGHVRAAEIKGGEVSVTMGFGGAAVKYALAVHENPRAGHTYGYSPSGKTYGRLAYKGKKRIGFSRVGQWKYLEQPFLARVAGFAERVRTRVLNG